MTRRFATSEQIEQMRAWLIARAKSDSVGYSDTSAPMRAEVLMRDAELRFGRIAGDRLYTSLCDLTLCALAEVRP